MQVPQLDSEAFTRTADEEIQRPATARKRRREDRRGWMKRSTKVCKCTNCGYETETPESHAGIQNEPSDAPLCGAD